MAIGVLGGLGALVAIKQGWERSKGDSQQLPS